MGVVDPVISPDFETFTIWSGSSLPKEDPDGVTNILLSSKRTEIFPVEPCVNPLSKIEVANKHIYSLNLFSFIFYTQYVYLNLVTKYLIKSTDRCTYSNMTSNC